MRIGKKSSIRRLCQELYPDAPFDEKDFLSLCDDLPLEAKKAGIYLDYSDHEGKYEGLPYNLNFIIKDGMSKKIVVNFKDAIISSGMTKTELAQQTKLRPNTITDYYAGKFDKVKLATLAKICKILGVTDFNQIFQWVDENGNRVKPEKQKGTENLKGFKEKLERMRAYSNTTFKDIAKESGISKQAVQQNLDHKMTVEKLVRYTEAMELTVSISDNAGHNVVLDSEDFK